MGRIVHLGLGNFHRAHQAWYTAHACDDWRITGVAITNQALADSLAAEGGYTLLVRHPEGDRRERVTVHDRVLVLRSEPEAVIAALADPEVSVITLTLTEKGYGLTPDGGFDPSSPGIADDIATGGTETALAALVKGLAARDAPVTVISCDNLPENGQRLQSAVTGFAEAAGLQLTAEMAFPSTMVDRITPAKTAALQQETGDPNAVATEAFSEWVIEDRFAAARPRWEAAGAVFADDVAPYEARKLYILNAAHSLLAYMGPPRGHRFVHQAIADPVLRGHVEGLWAEAEALLPPSMRESLPEYRAALLERFSVAAMAHRLDQIAQDGVQKIPIRILPILRAQLNQSPAAPHSEAALAAWVRHRAEECEADLDAVLSEIGAADLKERLATALDTQP